MPDSPSKSGGRSKGPAGSSSRNVGCLYLFILILLFGGFIILKSCQGGMGVGWDGR